MRVCNVCVSTVRYRFDLAILEACLFVCDFALDRGMDEEREKHKEGQKERLCVTKRMSKLFTQDTVNGYCVHA